MAKDERTKPVNETEPEAANQNQPQKVVAARPSGKSLLLDPFVQDDIYPDPRSIFAFVPVGLEEALADGLVAIDTNALVLPYGTGASSLKQIRAVYQRLTREKKLRIPARVAREFADVRASKLTTLFKQIQTKQNVNIQTSKYPPLLEGMKEYEELRHQEEEISSALDKYRKNIGKLLERVSEWRWNDPVSSIYREFFSADVLVELQHEREELLKDHNYRVLNKIPPGYKDQAKDDLGVGDFIIWKTLLSIGQKEKKHLVWVTGEEKADWWHRSAGQALYPRFELIDEYRRNSDGKSLAVISFSQLLEAYDVSQEVVAEVQEVQHEEGNQQLSLAISSSSRPIDATSRQSEIVSSVIRWVRSTNPHAEIQLTESFPDFWVQAPSGPHAYEVKVIGKLSSARRRLREAILDAGVNYRLYGTPMNLVLVIFEPDSLSVVTHIIDSYFAREDIETPIRVYVGTIQDRIFSPHTMFQSRL